ncbi:hypothetical protein CDL15_Pgr027393 [Punica granatum]|uniref:Uncharacterized protein n=1 Tax=Punica granatum TaxID=22663 RepID=A0A218Y202_PUNGR|nr:hypothetical protein CDL15_Pgr027393 [Punica granatum]PKI41848.1 hypothetical protein CRG98_037753 [Punica granatum]
MELDRPDRMLADSTGIREKTSMFERLEWLLGECSETRLAVRKESALPEAPYGILLQGRWLLTPKRPPEVTVVVVWFHSCRVDPYSSTKITENRAPPGNRPDWAVFGSDVTRVVPDGILMQGQWLPTPKRPSEVTVVVFRRKESRIDLICKENAKIVRKSDQTWQSGYFFLLDQN